MSSSVKLPSCAIFLASWLKLRSVYRAMRNKIPSTTHPEWSLCLVNVNWVIIPVVERKSEKIDQLFMDLITCWNCSKLDHSWRGWNHRSVIVYTSSASMITNSSSSPMAFFTGCHADHSSDLKWCRTIGWTVVNDVLQPLKLCDRRKHIGIRVVWRYRGQGNFHIWSRKVVYEFLTERKGLYAIHYSTMA